MGEVSQLAIHRGGDRGEFAVRSERVADQLHSRDERREWVSKLVGEERQEFVFPLVGDFEAAVDFELFADAPP
jgi:hypothetical protein